MSTPVEPQSDTTRTLERRGLRMSVYGALFMAGLGLGFAELTGSDAVRLDGLFSLIGFVVGFIAMRVASLVMLPDDEHFHFGYAAYEPMLNLAKGLLIAFVTLFAALTAIDAIMDGGRPIRGSMAVAYALIAASGCFLISFLQRRLAKRTDSPLLRVDVANWLIDGLLSSAVAVVFVAAALMDGTRFAHLVPYADPAVVLLLSLASAPIPFAIIRENWRQLLGRAPHDEIQEQITAKVNEALAGETGLKVKLRLLETGRWLYVQVYVIVGDGHPAMTVAELDALRQRVYAALCAERPELGIDVVFTTDEQWFLRTTHCQRDTSVPKQTASGG